MKRVYTITIFDLELTIKTDADERRVQEVAAFVRRKYDQIKAAAPQVPSADQMALTVLDVANDYFEMRDLMAQLQTQVESKSDQLIARIESLA